jgi:hypothetical protein
MNVIKNGSTYYCYLLEAYNGNLPTEIFLYESTDLHTWTLNNTDPQIAITQTSWEIDQVADPSVLDNINGTSYIFYAGYDNAGSITASIGVVSHNGPITETIIRTLTDPMSFNFGSEEKQDTSSLSACNIKDDYINVCGPDSPIRFTKERIIDLCGFLPNYLKQTEVYDLLKFFENYLNTLFPGKYGYSISTSAGTSADYITYIDPSNISTNTMSILEKVNRLTELHDPNLIDLEYLQYFANNLGYNININRGELGNLLATDTGACSAVDLDKYLRFVVTNLPSWYKIKTTKNAIKVMLYSFGLIGDISEYYTDSYLPESQGGKWISPGNQFENDTIMTVPNNFYSTPHYAIWVDLNKSSSDLNWDYDKREQIINAIESIRPINNVFRNLAGYYKTFIDVYIGMQAKYTYYLKIPNDGYADSWVL